MSGSLNTSGTPGFGEHCAAVVPHATTKFQPSHIYVGGAGIVVVDTAGGETDQSFTVPAGGTVPVQCIRVKATSTATLMMRLW